MLQWLVTDAEGVYVDCTLGGGGHSAALLASLGPGARVVGLDRDPAALKEASERLAAEVCRHLFGTAVASVIRHFRKAFCPRLKAQILLAQINLRIKIQNQP